MGCGASSHANDGDDWASKKEGVWNANPGSLTTPEGVLKADGPPENVALASDDDEPEIEFICPPSSSPKRLEPHPLSDLDAGQSAQTKPCPAPDRLSKQQKEQAAKLAETRKRFNNERYYRKHSSSRSVDFNMRGRVNQGFIDSHRHSLPGGVPDDSELQFQGFGIHDQQAQAVKKYDADDERLMKEIEEQY